MNKMEIIRALLCESNIDTEQQRTWELECAYLIRLVTHYWVGRLVGVGEKELIIENASWVPDTGRYYTAISTGKLNEIEPVSGRVVIGRSAVVDAVRWQHALPTEAK